MIVKFDMFKVGDVALCQESVQFVSGRFYKEGEEYPVTFENLSELNSCQENFHVRRFVRSSLYPEVTGWATFNR